MKFGINFDHDVTVLFCQIDDFCKEYENHLGQNLIGNTPVSGSGEGVLSLSEIMTILMLYHLLNLRTFKYHYDFVSTYLRRYFPDLVSYNRFVELTKRAFVPMSLFTVMNTGKRTGVYYIDATKLEACHYKRSGKNKVFKNMADYGCTSIGKFFGMKLHLVINDQGELIAFKLTSGNVHDIKAVETISKDLHGMMFGDKGYVGKKVAETLLERGLKLITKVRNNMKKPLLSKLDKQLLRQRGIIETVIDHLKNHLNIWHSRYRSVINAMTHLVTALACYCIEPMKISAIKALADFSENSKNTKRNNLIKM